MTMQCMIGQNNLNRDFRGTGSGLRFDGTTLS